jgi:hypothetical protein
MLRSQSEPAIYENTKQNTKQNAKTENIQNAQEIDQNKP